MFINYVIIVNNGSRSGMRWFGWVFLFSSALPLEVSEFSTVVALDFRLPVFVFLSRMT